LTGASATRTRFTRNSPEPGIVQSIFSPAARRDTPRGTGNFDRRDGELKMDWTKPLDDGRPMGVEWLTNS
jgi:hypothetical protein